MTSFATGPIKLLSVVEAATFRVQSLVCLRFPQANGSPYLQRRCLPFSGAALLLEEGFKAWRTMENMHAKQKT